jgi:hypothetical protein
LRWLERRNLLLQLADQIRRLDSRIAGDVIDRLFRIERRALPAGAVERVDDMAAHLQHAAFEHREQADRAGAYDRNIGAVGR